MLVRTVDGTEVAVGDADEPFSLQSMTKVLSLVLARPEVWPGVGKESSATPFIFLSQLETDRDFRGTPSSMPECW